MQISTKPQEPQVSEVRARPQGHTQVSAPIRVLDTLRRVLWEVIFLSLSDLICAMGQDPL